MKRNRTIKDFFKSNLLIILLLILAVFFSTINFFYSLYCYILLGALLILRRCKEGRSYAVLLFITYLCFFYFASNNPNVTFHNVLWYTVLPFLAFYIGRQIGSKIFSELYLVLWFFILMLCLSINSIPITIYDIFQYGIINPERDLQVLADEETTRRVTSRTMDLSLALSGFCCLFFLKTQYHRLVRLFIAFAVLAILCVFHYVSRTGIVLAAVSILIGLFFSNKSIKTLFAILFIFLILILISNTEIFNIYAAREIKGSSFSDSGGRLERWQLGFDALLANPEGYGMSGFYAHNYWLDFGRDGGLISALLLFLFNISLLIKYLFFSIKKKQYSYFIRCLIFSYMFISFLAAFSEPIHTGSPGYTWTYMTLCGLMSTSPEKRILTNSFSYSK